MGVLVGAACEPVIIGKYRPDKIELAINDFDTAVKSTSRVMSQGSGLATAHVVGH
jgi:hypothetical protein